MKHELVMFVVLVLVGFSHGAWAQSSPKWRVQMGARVFTPQCDEIGDLVIGGEDGKTPIYSCRMGEYWQAAKGNQLYTPRCRQMSHIWWSSEHRMVQYTCTSGEVFAGSQAQLNSPWKFRYVKEDGSLCSPSYSFPYPCNYKMVNEDHMRGYDYIDVRPRRFPEGVIELSFQWAPPAPATPQINASDVEVVARVADPDPPIFGITHEEYIARFRSAQSPRVPDGMSSADPTKVPNGKPAAVSCGDEAVTSYLGQADRPIWIKYEDGKRRACVGKTLGKAWDEIWDLKASADGMLSYFARDGGGDWRLVSGTREAQAFANIRWHEWVAVNGVDKRAYIATDKAGESTEAVYGLLDGQQLFRATKPVKMLRFIPAAGTFVFAIQG